LIECRIWRAGDAALSVRGVVGVSLIPVVCDGVRSLGFSMARPLGSLDSSAVEFDPRTELAFSSHVDYFRDASRRGPGGAVHEEDGLLLYAGPHPLPFLVNGAIRVEPGLGAVEVIDRARAFFGARERGFSLYALVGRDDDLIEAADEEGMISFGEPAPLMAQTGPPSPVDSPAGVQIERAITPEQIADAAAVCADAYAVYGMPADVAPTCVVPATMLAPHIAAVVAYDQDGPVATASAMATHGVAYILWVGTTQRAMRRGLGEAVTRAATLAGHELGARMTTLMASPMGAPVYRRMGFLDVGHLASRIATDANT
jgi:hypothetical protein